MGRYKDPNTGNWVKETAMPVGDTLPIGSEVEYNGSVVPYGWEEVGLEDISSKITPTSLVTNVYSISAYKKENRCFLNAQVEISNKGNILTLANDIKPKRAESWIANNYSTNAQGINNCGFVRLKNNNENIEFNLIGAANIAPYLVFHAEWEV